MAKEQICPDCGGKGWVPIPDSLAAACEKCGCVMVCGERGVSLAEWAKDFYESKKKQEKEKEKQDGS